MGAVLLVVEKVILSKRILSLELTFVLYILLKLIIKLCHFLIIIEGNFTQNYLF